MNQEMVVWGYDLEIWTQTPEEITQKSWKRLNWRVKWNGGEEGNKY